jgi:hypothetical protein
MSVHIDGFIATGQRNTLDQFVIFQGIDIEMLSVLKGEALCLIRADIAGVQIVMTFVLLQKRLCLAIRDLNASTGDLDKKIIGGYAVFPAPFGIGMMFPHEDRLLFIAIVTSVDIKRKQRMHATIPPSVSNSFFISSPPDASVAQEMHAGKPAAAGFRKH